LTGWWQWWCFAYYSTVVARWNRNIGHINHAIASQCVLLFVIYRSVFIVSESFILGGRVAAFDIFLVGALYDLHLILVPDFFLCGLQLLVCQFPHITVLDEFRKQTSLANFRLYSKISSGDA